MVESSLADPLLRRLIVPYHPRSRPCLSPQREKARTSLTLHPHCVIGGVGHDAGAELRLVAAALPDPGAAQGLLNPRRGAAA
jgi:hypothetical protein